MKGCQVNCQYLVPLINNVECDLHTYIWVQVIKRVYTDGQYWLKPLMPGEYWRYRWQRICSSYRKHATVLSFFMTYQKVLGNWYHQHARVFDWQHICYVWWTCFSTDSRHTYGYKLCFSSHRLVPLLVWGKLHTWASQERRTEASPMGSAI